MAPIIVSFDGNIGSGKSSIVHYFEKNFDKFCNKKGKNYNICFLQEPVSIWESIKDENGKNIDYKSKLYNLSSWYLFLTDLKEVKLKDGKVIFI